MCKMILYMEQYIITTYSGRTHDPATVPSCQQPDKESCDTMICSWKNLYRTPINHTYQFLRCAKPQAFRLILQAGLHVLNGTYDRSIVIPVNDTLTLNITVKRPSDGVFGFEVGKPLDKEGVYIMHVAAFAAMQSASSHQLYFIF